MNPYLDISSIMNTFSRVLGSYDDNLSGISNTKRGILIAQQLYKVWSYSPTFLSIRHKNVSDYKRFVSGFATELVVIFYITDLSK